MNVLGMAAISEQDMLRSGTTIDTTSEASLTRDASTSSLILTGVAGAAFGQHSARSVGLAVDSNG